MQKPVIRARIDVASRILIVRGVRVLIDADLAELYGVPTKRLNEQVKRNSGRFPADFAFRLTKPEKEEVVANCDHLTNLKYSPALPRVFTEHGALMAANILQSEAAIEMSVFVVRAFVRLREDFEANAELSQRLAAIESRLSRHDGQIGAMVTELRRFLTAADPVPKRRRIGFVVEGS